MNEELAETIRIHATQGLQQFHEHISSKSKEELQNMLAELIKMYMADKNSSTLREKFINFKGNCDGKSCRI